MTTLNHSPVALPPRSYDYEELKRGLQTAAHASAEKRDGAVEEVLGSIAKGDAPAQSTLEPGFVIREVAHPEIEGLVEHIQVYDAPAETKAEAAPASKPKRTASAKRKSTAAKKAPGASSTARSAQAAPSGSRTTPTPRGAPSAPVSAPPAPTTADAASTAGSAAMTE